MTDKIETGGPAFPGKQKSLLIKAEHIDIASQYDIETNGMTLRDYFAAKAMPMAFEKYKDGHEDGIDGIARWAYFFADAMLKARE